MDGAPSDNDVYCDDSEDDQSRTTAANDASGTGERKKRKRNRANLSCTEVCRCSSLRHLWLIYARKVQTEKDQMRPNEPLRFVLEAERGA